MNQFKNTYDALVAAFENERAIANRIDERFAESDVEGALALEAELDAAQAQSEKIGALYNKLANVGSEDPAQYFVPASEPADEGAETGPQTMPRAEFDALEPLAKAEFVAGCGVIADEEAQE